MAIEKNSTIIHWVHFRDLCQEGIKIKNLSARLSVCPHLKAKGYVFITCKRINRRRKKPSGIQYRRNVRSIARVSTILKIAN